MFKMSLNVYTHHVELKVPYHSYHQCLVNIFSFLIIIITSSYTHYIYINTITL